MSGGTRLALLALTAAALCGAGAAFWFMSERESAAQAAAASAAAQAATRPVAPGSATPPGSDAPAKPLERPKLFPVGPKPALCLVLSGQMYGYLQPCGCARPQVGGMERRFELVKELQDQGIPVSAADVGDLAPKETGVQPRMKYETALKMLKEMPYAAVGLGSAEFEDLEEALGRAQNYQPPMALAANLLDPKNRFPEMYKGWTTAQPDAKGMKIGYLGLVGPSVMKKALAKDPALAFEPPETALPKALAELKKEQADLVVLLYQGTPAEAEELFRKFPDAFHVILSKADADIASALPTRLKRPDGTEALLVNVGHKGRSVGLVAIDREAGKLKFRYQMVELIEPYELPDEKTNPVRDHMKEYVLAVYRAGLLTKVPISEHDHQRRPGLENAVFIGAAKCQECHPSAHKVWSGSKHHLGWTNLAKYGRPLAERDAKDGGPKTIGRQHDPECASCHVTGFATKGGFIDEQRTPLLLGNQCENCHGPGSLHAAFPKDTKFSTPMRLTLTDPITDRRCRTCHDGDNDPHFDLQKYWPQIKHGKEAGAAGK